MRNYDSSQPGVAYVRVPEIHITYTEQFHTRVRAKEVEAVMLADGSVRQFGESGELQFGIDPADFGTDVQLVDPNTDLPIPGATMTIQQVMLGIFAVIRHQQGLRDDAQGA